MIRLCLPKVLCELIHGAFELVELFFHLGKRWRLGEGQFGGRGSGVEQAGASEIRQAARSAARAGVNQAIILVLGDAEQDGFVSRFGYGHGKSY